MNDFYVYEYIRHQDGDYPAGTVAYVGKGRKRRINSPWAHRYFPTPEFRRIVKSGISESEAVELERALIKKYGRKNTGTGCLVNLTDGGDGLSGYVATDETRALISKRIAEVGHPHLGKKMPREWVCRSMVTKMIKRGFCENEAIQIISEREKSPKQVQRKEPAGVWGKCMATGQEIFFKSQQQAADYVGGDQACISMCARGKITHAYKWFWSFTGEFLMASKRQKNIPILAIAESGAWIPFSAVSRAVDFLANNGHPKATTGGISFAKKTGGTAYGFKWFNAIRVDEPIHCKR
jgi:hypothetical protein